LNHDELWDAIDTQRVRTCDLLSGLTPREWERPSLCEGWTVRDVAAHLTMQQTTLGGALRMMLRHPGGVNHVINASARERAALPTDQLIARIRATIGSRRHNVGVTPAETLLDIVVHGQDIAIPLGRTLEVSPEVAATAASGAWAYRLSWKGRMSPKVFHALPYDDHRLVATDTDWAVGEGTEIRGPVLAILLLLTGRPVMLPQLGGPGASELAARLTPARPPG
jgi:uncharacterized protein (TIGR03083 family)